MALIGKSFAVPNTVRNVSAATAGASTLRFVLSANGTLGDDDPVLAIRAVGSLVGGSTSAATTTLTIPAATAPGVYTLFAVVDALNVVTEQDESNNVRQAPLIVVANVQKTFSLSGDLTESGCTSSLRDGQLAAQGTLALSSQAGTSLAGILVIIFPLATGLKISGPVQAMVSSNGTLGGTFTYTMAQGSTTIGTGTGTIAGSVNAGGTTMSVTLTGTHATGETCDFTAEIEAPITPIGFLAFQGDTRAGNLEAADGSFVATPHFPLTIDRNRMLFDVALDSGFPNPAAVAFVDPNQSASPAATLTQLAPSAAEYAGSWVSGTGLAGAWVVQYKGADYNFMMPDPDEANRLVVPILAFVSINGSIQQMTWSYAGPTGNALNGLPSFMRLIRVQVFDPCGVVLHDSLGLEPTTTSRTLNPPVPMSRIAEIRFQLVDDQGNIVTVHYGDAVPGNCKMFEFTAPSYSVAENSTPAHVTVSRVGDLTAGPVTVDFHTSDGTAHAPVDYLDASQTLTFSPGWRRRWSP